ncbi:MAG: glycine cleavage system aminomethyltransferase GcvT [candidate division KSB1 bacterium]|nr:glycine cleavage system aminomethyltransferase GcvT [candidate division KSB1 bacterium]MDZ7304609.1 glycine cleavage system aminomethyltransferase GcvT [candidate division KSB1 bacterium]MDZ7313742.1 glycine cleavage system aminomethyltransferase GcvT [candidate division KSB1 bacterium]
MSHDAVKAAAIKKTALYDIHAGLGAKLVEFAGYWMPVQYRGIIEEHRKVRSSVGVFDVSHMGEFEFRGKAASEFLQRMTINDISRLQEYQAQYSAICYPDGGIVDDVIVYRWPDRYMMVVNASNIEKDFAWLSQHATPEVGLVNSSDEISLFAVQGRHAQATLQKIVNVNLAGVKYYWFISGEIAGVPAFISRTGYTGEDGFEVGVAVPYSEKVWNAIFEAGKEFGIEPIGLGARDTLRLEMKYCLYGNDIDQTTNPLEAGLGWITKMEKGDFIGRDAILKIKTAGIARKLVGFELEGKNIARHGYPILKEGAQIGRVTSGTFSPSLEKSIGMGYVASEHATVDTELAIDIRGRVARGRVVKTPFYQRPY